MQKSFPPYGVACEATLILAGRSSVDGALWAVNLVGTDARSALPTAVRFIAPAYSIALFQKSDTWADSLDDPDTLMA